ncbi:hypothetical protein [Arenibaculum pallidiluteum]|uniref:hypothetical protein n=1 Tax=Arenibaculum pallidiluteum TaxID=2812559 RepID=UPI001A958AD7|nr:hypothetical protein [Arenibaculum pallidiluteum]
MLAVYLSGLPVDTAEKIIAQVFCRAEELGIVAPRLSFDFRVQGTVGLTIFCSRHGDLLRLVRRLSDHIALDFSRLERVNRLHHQISEARRIPGLAESADMPASARRRRVPAGRIARVPGFRPGSHLTLLDLRVALRAMTANHPSGRRMKRSTDGAAPGMFIRGRARAAFKSR